MAIVTMASLLVVLALSKALRNRWLWLAAVIAPLAVAYCVYWAPVWIGGNDPAQASAWETLVMIAWGAPATLACLVFVAVVRLRRPRVR